MGIFNFDWLMSDERKRLRTLQIAEQEMKNELLSKKLVEKAQEMANVQPYRKIIYNNGALTVILKDGNVLTRKGADQFLFTQVQNAYSEDVVKSLMAPAPIVKETPLYTKEEVQLVQDNIGILRNHPDFDVIGDNVFLRGVKLPLPPIVLASMIEVIEHINYASDIVEKADDIVEEDSAGYLQIKWEKRYEALKNFWRWTALNPIESSRNDLLSFVKKNKVAITENGLLELYRRVVSVGAENKELVKFVSEQYFKIKKWKKSPKSYEICQNNGNYRLLKVNEYAGDTEPVGNLEDLYLNLPNMMENVYTDNHTRTKVIKVGHVYKEDEDKINLNNNVDCGSGLHVGAMDFGFSGFGDTGVVALVNPMKVRSVPTSEATKMRVSEMFIAAVVDLQDYKEHVESGDISDYSDEYYNICLEELEQELANKSYGKLSCQENVPAMKIADIQEIKNSLKQRVVNI